MLDIETRQNAKFDKLLDSLKVTSDEVKEVKELISSREQAVLEEVRERDQKTNNRIDELAKAVALGNSKGTKLTESYIEHRRSLRFWPVKGTEKAELRPALAVFLRENLKFTSEEIIKLGSISVRKHRDAASKVPDEVLVIFESKQSRDVVKAAGKHLADNSSAGMRLHIPPHLEPNFKILQSLGYHLRQSDENLRRSIKFDDEHEDLAMDVRIDGTWSRIRPAQAREVCSQNPDIYSGPKQLSTAGISKLLKKKTPATGANAMPTE